MTTLGTVGVEKPIGEYILKLKAINTVESTFEGGGDYWQWVFACEGVASSRDPLAWEQVGEEIWGATGTSLGPTAKAPKWVKAILRRDLVRGEKIEIEDLIGKTVIGNILPYTKKSGEETTRLEILTPMKKGIVAAPRPEASESDDEDLDENFD